MLEFIPSAARDPYAHEDPGFSFQIVENEGVLNAL